MVSRIVGITKQNLAVGCCVYSGLKPPVVPRLSQHTQSQLPHIHTLSVQNSYDHQKVSTETQFIENNSEIENCPEPLVKTVIHEEPELTYGVGVVQGKGPPPEPPVVCCGTGCANCVWIKYAESLGEYYNDGGEAALQAVEQIEDPSVKAFVKLELGLL